MKTRNLNYEKIQKGAAWLLFFLCLFLSGLMINLNAQVTTISDYEYNIDGFCIGEVVTIVGNNPSDDLSCAFEYIAGNNLISGGSMNFSNGQFELSLTILGAGQLVMDVIPTTPFGGTCSLPQPVVFNLNPVDCQIADGSGSDACSVPISSITAWLDNLEFSYESLLTVTQFDLTAIGQGYLYGVSDEFVDQSDTFFDCEGNFVCSDWGDPSFIEDCFYIYGFTIDQYPEEVIFDPNEDVLPPAYQGDCSEITVGTVELVQCDPGNPAWSIVLEDGTSFLPIFDEGVEFLLIEGMSVTFDYTTNVNATTCGVDFVANIACIEQAFYNGGFVEAITNGSNPNNLPTASSNQTISICSGESVILEGWTTMIDCPGNNCGGPSGYNCPPFTQPGGQWRVSNTANPLCVDCIDIIVAPTQTTTFSHHTPGYECDYSFSPVINSDPNEPAGPAQPAPSYSELNLPAGPIISITVVVEEDCDTNPETPNIPNPIGPVSPVNPNTTPTENINIADYPWIFDLIDLGDCTTESVTAYVSGAYVYFYIQTPTGNSLYFETGTFYCSDAPNYNCINAYGLSDGLVVLECEENFPAPSGFCSEPLTPIELDNGILQSIVPGEYGKVILQHYSPTLGYFYEITNLCPYPVLGAGAVQYASDFYNCQGEEICSLGGLVGCLTPVNDATESYVMQYMPCGTSGTEHQICLGESVLLTPTGPTPGGAAGPTSAYPQTYNCGNDMPFMTISPNDGGPSAENGFLVSPTVTTTYTITMNAGNLDSCPPRSFVHTVIVEDCETPATNNCSEPLTFTEFSDAIGGLIIGQFGKVVLQHYGPTLGYFYEVRNLCPYVVAGTGYVAYSSDFYNCQGEEICSIGGFANCPTPVSEATETIILQTFDCETEAGYATLGVKHDICAGESVLLEPVGPYGNGPLSPESYPQTYNCEGNTVLSISPNDGAIASEGGFLASPTVTTTYVITEDANNGTCPPKSFVHTVYVEDCEQLPEPIPTLTDITICAGESVDLQGFSTLIQCDCEQSQFGPTDCFPFTQPGGYWTANGEVICNECIDFVVAPTVTTVYTHYTPEYTCPPVFTTGPQPPQQSFPDSPLISITVTVEACGTPPNNCEQPLTYSELSDVLGGITAGASGKVILQHYSPTLGYFYEIRNLCPYEVAGTGYVPYSSNFYNCEGEEICSIGGLVGCGAPVDEATETIVLETLDCGTEGIEHDICAGESVFLEPTGPYGLGPVGPTSSYPETYNCEGNTSLSISPNYGVVESDDGFVVSPNVTTQYIITLSANNGTCPPQSFVHTVVVDDCGEVEGIPEIFTSYLWLNNEVDYNDCDGTAITVYDTGNYSFLFIETDGVTTMYFQDGTFYCQDSPGFSCVAAYGLTNGETWDCGDSIEEPVNPIDPIDDEFPWLESLLNEFDCPTVTIYQLGGYDFIFIQPQTGYGTLYFQNGTFYCQDSANFSCVEAYNFPNTLPIITCGEELTYEEANFGNYTWLADIVDVNDCAANTQVVLYNSGIYTFVYVESESNQGTLYFQDGTLYCNDAPNYSCVDAYGLTTMNSSVLWTCGLGKSGNNLEEEQIVEGLNEMSSVDMNDIVSFEMYPNPSNGQLFVNISGQGAQILRVHSISGRTIREIEIDNNESPAKLKLDLSDLSTGLYLIELATDTDSKVQRLMIK